MNASLVQRLHAHRERLFGAGLINLFRQDSQRFGRFSARAAGLLMDYSKNHLDANALADLMELARVAGLADAIQALFDGQPVNHTEGRMALHTALRLRDEELPPAVADAVLDTRRRLFAAVARIQSGEWKGYTGKRIDTIVNIGVGGSDLGPNMAVDALQSFHTGSLRFLFVSNVDPSHISRALRVCDPETTLFIVASKTFTTLETLANAQAARDWFVQRAGSESAVALHFAAVSVNVTATSRFGITPENVFPMWDWVGGRYSLWSSIGMSIALALGEDGFREFLDGARELDQHFRTAPFEQNLPVIMALLGVWHVNFVGCQSQAVICYDQNLAQFPAYLQQLDMESNGKGVQRNGQPVEWKTGAVLWGGVGTNTQHSFHQLLHQGTLIVPVDFIVGVRSQTPVAEQQADLYANCLAQSQALMQGRCLAEVQQEMQAKGVDSAQIGRVAPHRVIAGNKPSTTLVYETLTPRILGALIALYEHKVFVQSVIWNINPFDQWGVELGKQLSGEITSILKAGSTDPRLDGSTQGLIDFFNVS
ncbi:MAG: glucose-6-phosphate isomerase [Gammaproteobacteria bacterium]|nr:glucose-6-phosphate isomerase [Gammaproteobacteria bacterium]